MHSTGKFESGQQSPVVDASPLRLAQFLSFAFYLFTFALFRSRFSGWAAAGAGQLAGGVAEVLTHLVGEGLQTLHHVRMLGRDIVLLADVVFQVEQGQVDGGLLVLGGPAGLGLCGYGDFV
jgi:hypothetical protein